MTAAWLTLTALLAFMALLTVWARRPTGARLAAVVSLPVAAVIAWYALTVPLGRPASPPAAGEYTVLGARIDTPTDNSAGAIYVLLDGDVPRYHRLPYTNETAEQLQGAMEGEQGAVMDVQEGGAFEFHEAPVEAEAPKQPERPALEIGG